MFNRITPIVRHLIFLNVIIYVALHLLGDNSPQFRKIENDYFRMHKSNLIGFRETTEVEFTEMYTESVNRIRAIYRERIGSPPPDSEIVLFYNQGIITGPGKFQPIQIVTWFFNHGSFMHILFNMLALFFIGPAVEQVLGSQRFLKFYLFCGILGGIMIAFLDPSSVPVVGASGAIFGVMVAFALFFPRQKFYFYFLIPIEARWFVLGIGTLSAILVLVDFAGLERGPDNISHFGHLTGMLAAFAYFYLQKYLPFLE